MGVQLNMGGGIDPSPTSDLKVSGRRLKISGIPVPIRRMLYVQDDWYKHDPAEDREEPED